MRNPAIEPTGLSFAARMRASLGRRLIAKTLHSLLRGREDMSTRGNGEPCSSGCSGGFATRSGGVDM